MNAIGERGADAPRFRLMNQIPELKSGGHLRDDSKPGGKAERQRFQHDVRTMVNQYSHLIPCGIPELPHIPRHSGKGRFKIQQNSAFADSFRRKRGTDRVEVAPQIAESFCGSALCNHRFRSFRNTIRIQPEKTVLPDNERRIRRSEKFRTTSLLPDQLHFRNAWTEKVHGKTAQDNRFTIQQKNRGDIPLKPEFRAVSVNDNVPLSAQKNSRMTLKQRSVIRIGVADGKRKRSRVFFPENIASGLKIQNGIRFHFRKTGGKRGTAVAGGREIILFHTKSQVVSPMKVGQFIIWKTGPVPGF